jgi:tetratricopeptide (TPR) repeat protein
MALAETAYNEGRYEEAIGHYAAAAAKAPSELQMSSVYLTLATLQHAQGQSDEARASLTQAVFHNPALTLTPERHPVDFLDLFYDAQKSALALRTSEADQRIRDGRQALDEGRLSDARRLLDEGLRFVPNQPTALALLALVELREGKTDAAVAGFERLLSLRQAQPGLVSDDLAASALANLGKLYLGRRFHEDAAARLRQAVELDSSLGDAWIDLSTAQAALGQREEARASLLRARALRPGDETVLHNLGVYYVESQRWQEAIELLADATERNPQSVRLWSLLAESRRSSGDSQGAETAFRRVLALDQANQEGAAFRAARSLALLLYERNDDAAAVAEARRALGWEPKDALTLTYLALAEQRRGNLDAAIAAFEQAAQADPKKPEPLNYLGSAYFQALRYPDAIGAFERALNLRPNFVEASENLDLARKRQAELDSIEAHLGIKVTRVAEPGSTKGLRIESLVPESVAARAGILAGDLLTRIEGAPVETPADLNIYLTRSPPLRALAAEWLRQSRLMKGKLRLNRD